MYNLIIYINTGAMKNGFFVKIYYRLCKLVFNPSINGFFSKNLEIYSIW